MNNSGAGKKSEKFRKNLQFRKFQAYGFLKNLRFFEAFLLLYFLSIDLSFTQIGTLYAIREISRYVFEIPSGVMADSWGRRRTLASSFLFYIASFALYYFGSTFLFMAFAMFFYAIGDAFRSGTHKAMIFEYLRLKGWEDQKADYYGHTRAASQAGSAVSSVIAAFIVFLSKNYQLIFLFSVIPYILDFLLIISYPSTLENSGIRQKKAKFLSSFKDTFGDFILSFKNPEILKRIFMLSSFSGYYKAARDYLQALIKSGVLLIPFLNSLEKEQKTSILVGAVYFFIYLMNSIASKNSSKILDQTQNSKKALYTTLFIGFAAGLASGILYMTSQPLLAIVPFLLIFIIENLRKPVGIAYLSDSIEKNILASSLSAESQLSSIMAGVYAIVIGFIADRFSVGISLTGVSGFLIISLVLVLLLTKSKNSNG
jgi:MFS family permease